MTTPKPTAIVTGATSGVGLATARTLQAKGWQVLGVARGQSRLADLEQGTPAGAESIQTLSADLSSFKAAAAVAEACKERFGRLDALINNAGLAKLEPLGTTSDADIVQVMMLNAAVPLALLRDCWPMLSDRKAERRHPATVVNLASYALVSPFPGFAAYGAAKCAIDSLTRTVAVEGKRAGVNAYTVAPSGIETPMLRGMFNEIALPSEACLDPQSVADLIVACAANERPNDSGRSLFIQQVDGSPLIQVGAPPIEL